MAPHLAFLLKGPPAPTASGSAGAGGPQACGYEVDIYPRVVVDVFFSRWFAAGSALRSCPMAYTAIVVCPSWCLRAALSHPSVFLRSLA